MVWSEEDESDYETDDDDDSGSDDFGSESDDYNLDEVDEIPATVPRLEKIASVNVAIALWNRATVVIPGMITHQRKWLAESHRELSKWINALSLPKSITNCIYERFYTVKYSVAEWIHYISRTVFFGEGKVSELYQHIDRIIWYPNGRINSAETARNLLKSDKLTNGEKFCLASTYCLQEEIEKMWPMLEKSDLIEEYDFYWNPLICYWSCYYTDKLNVIQRRSILPIDEFMIQLCNVDNWSAIEYFFDRLGTDQQVSAATRLVDDYGVRYQKLLLLKLNESQRLLVLVERVVDIISYYAEYVDTEEDAIATWYDVRNLITKDQFLFLFRELLTYETVGWILMEIWNTARDDLKRHNLNFGDNYFIKKVLKWLLCYGESGLTFVSSVLLDRASVDIKRDITKKPFFSECCIRLVCYSNLELLDRLLNVCLNDAAKSTEFKKSLVKSPYFSERCKTLIIGRHIRTLVKLLGFAFSVTDPSSVQFVREMLDEHLKLLNDLCLTYYSGGYLTHLDDLLAPLTSSYPEIVSEYKSNLLLSDDGFKACIVHFGSRKSILPRIIADGVPTNSAIEFKRKIIFSPEGINKLKSMMTNGQSSIAKKLIDWYLESKRARKKLKKELVIV